MNRGGAQVERDPRRGRGVAAWLAVGLAGALALIACGGSEKPAAGGAEGAAEGVAGQEEAASMPEFDVGGHVLERWTGDLDGMIARRRIRALRLSEGSRAGVCVLLGRLGVGLEFSGFVMRLLPRISLWSISARNEQSASLPNNGFGLLTAHAKSCKVVNGV